MKQENSIYIIWDFLISNQQENITSYTCGCVTGFIAYKSKIKKKCIKFIENKKKNNNKAAPLPIC